MTNPDSRSGAFAARRDRLGLALLGLVLLGGLFARTRGLASMPLWLDELRTLGQARLHVADILRTTTTHPPGYALLGHGALLLAGPDFCVRIPAVLGGLAGVGAVYLTLRALGQHAIALFGAALASLSVYAVYYSQEARGYSWMSALTGLAVALAIDRRQAASAPRLACVLWVGIAFILFHFMAVLVVAPLFSVLLGADLLRLRHGRPARGRLLAWASLIPGVAALALLERHQLDSLLSHAPLDATTGLAVGPRFVMEHLGLWMGLGRGAGVVVLISVLLGAFVAFRCRPSGGLVLGACAFGPFALLAIAPWDRPYAAKYLMGALVPSLALAACGPAILFDPRIRLARRWASGACCALALSAIAREGWILHGYLARPAKAQRWWLVSDYQLQNLSLDSQLNPWMVRSLCDDDFSASMTTLGSLELPAPSWPVLGREELFERVRKFRAPGERVPPESVSSDLYLVNPAADEVIEVQVSSTREQAAGAERIEARRCRPPFLARFEKVPMAAAKHPALMVRYAETVTGGPVSYQQLSWCCPDLGQVDITVKSGRSDLAWRYLSEACRRARCH